MNHAFPGRTLHRLRKKAGLKQLELARLAGCSQAAVVFVETGARQPSWGLAVRLAQALGVSVAVFEGKS
jgi:transcriptional regulator with XRE-family HTH domain